MANLTPRTHRALLHADLPTEDKVALTQLLDKLGVTDDLEALGGILNSLEPLLEAVTEPLPGQITDEWHELTRLARYKSGLHGWDEEQLTPFKHEAGVYPLLAALCAPVETPEGEQARLLKQVLLAVALAQDPGASETSTRLASAADQVRLACGLGSMRERTLAPLPALPFSADTVVTLGNEVARLLGPTSRGFDRPLLRAVRFLCRALEEAPSGLPDLPPLTAVTHAIHDVVAGHVEGMPRLLKIRPKASTEDAAVAEPVQALLVKPGGPGEDVSRTQVRQEEAAATYALAEAADWLPWKKASLDPVESQDLTDYLKTLDERPGDPIHRLFFGLVIATDDSVAELLAYPFGPDAILTPDGRLRKRRPLPDDAFKPKPEHAGYYLDTHVDEFEVTLPRPVRVLLAEVLAGRTGATLGEALGIEPEAAPDITETLGEMLKAIAGPRLSVRHLARVLRDRVGQETQDTIATALVTGPVEAQLPVTSAYLAFEVRRLLGIYASATASLFGESQDPSLAADPGAATLGSRCTPDRDKLRAEVQGFAARMERVMKDATLTHAERHNAYTLYVAELIRVSGIRPVTDFAAFSRSIGLTHSVVEDKAPTERHACRPEAASATIRAQVAHYRAYAASLAGEFLRGEATRPMGAAVISMLSEPHSEGMLPFLFLLNEDCTEATSLSPKTLKASKADWPYPVNLSRHLLATGMTTLGAPAHLRQLELGHLAAGEVHLGECSLLSPQEEFAKLEALIERILQDQGWTALPGPLPVRPLPALPEGVTPYRHATLGPVERALGRSTKRKAARRALRELLALAPRTPHPDQSLFDTVRQELIQRTEDDPGTREWAEKLWWRFSRRHQDPLNPLIPPWHFSCYAAAYPTFWRDQPFYSDVAGKARRRFVELLSERVDDEERPSRARRAAEILTSASLFGGYFSRKGLDHLRTTDADDYVAVVSVVTLQRVDKKGVMTRWATDRLTGALVDSNAKKGPPPTKREVFRELRAILSIVAPEISAKDPLKVIADLGRALWRTIAPGFLWSYADRTLSAAPLRTETLKRVLSGQRLKFKIEAALDADQVTAASIPLGKPGSLAETRQAYKELCGIIREIREARAEGSIHSRAAERLAFLTKHKEVYGDRWASLPCVAGALIGWAEHLAHAGTAARPRLALSSILRYICALNGLIDAAYDIDLAALSGDGFEELYRKVLDAAPKDGRPYIARRIVEFHRYLTTIYPIEQPSWAFLPRSAARHVDANLISYREYRSCLDILYDPQSTDAGALQRAAILVLGFRFGLRAGEICRLRYADLTLDFERGHVVVDVDNNFYGRTKSLAGRRRVPLIGTLDPIEREILLGLKEAFEMRVKRHDPIAGLFADPDDPRAVITCARLFQQIHEAMRLATGDGTLRFHHNRHAFGTRLVLGLVGDRFQSEAVAELTEALFGYAPCHADLRKYLTLDAECGPVTLKAIPMLLGHADLTTSIGSYMHAMDFLLAAECDRQLGDIPVDAWAYALGKKVGTVQRQVDRLKASSGKCGATDACRTYKPKRVPAAKIDAAPGKPPTRLPARVEPEVRIDLATRSEVLDLLKTRDGDTFGVARSLRLPEETVARTLKAAREFEDRGGCPAVSARSSRGFYGPEREAAVLPPSLVKERKRFNDGLRDWDEILNRADDEVREKIRCGLGVSIAVGTTIRNRWVFPHEDVLKPFVAMLGVLRIPPGYLSARLEVAPLSEERRDRILEDLKGLGLIVGAGSVVSGPWRVSLTMIPGNHRFAFQTTLNHALEVLWIHRRASNALD